MTSGGTEDHPLDQARMHSSASVRTEDLNDRIALRT
jgi:hypothetical protein